MGTKIKRFFYLFLLSYALIGITQRTIAQAHSHNTSTQNNQIITHPFTP